MMKNKEYNIPFSGLKQGKHSFTYVINNSFFESFDYNEFNKVSVNLDVILNKTSTMLELSFNGTGVINLDCDVTSEPFDQPISSEIDLVVKFGDSYNDEDDEILIIPHGSFQINIAQYVYEMLVLAVPQKRIHPGIADGTLQSEVLDKLEELQPKVVGNTNEKNDPRWDKLKNLLTDK